jgi:hypothetical protein
MERSDARTRMLASAPNSVGQSGRKPLAEQPLPREVLDFGRSGDRIWAEASENEDPPRPLVRRSILPFSFSSSPHQKFGLVKV